jgi:hypothetical protein
METNTLVIGERIKRMEKVYLISAMEIFILDNS